jgi:protein-glutamine gamma-glutamyltransferase
MIQISGSSFKLNDAWQLGSTEKTIIEHMENDPTPYSYYSADEFLFEIKVRTNIIKSAKEMDKGESPFTSFENAQCNPKYWQLTSTGGFMLRPNVQPAEAIQDIFTNSSLYGFECATACVIIYYHAILNSIGAALFNILFQNLYLYSWHTDSDLGLITFYSYHILPGDVVYFKNPDFHPQTPWFRGLNAVVLEDGKFFGHGFSIRDSDQIVQILNERRKPSSQNNAYLSNLVSRPSFNYLAKFISRQTQNTRTKIQRPILHHNKSSISYVQYLYHLI